MKLMAESMEKISSFVNTAHFLSYQRQDLKHTRDFTPTQNHLFVFTVVNLLHGASLYMNTRKHSI
eukprot:Seg6935.1 transcript_id=Seg6935.1/GoldUCD/mRNA.D3Y31 product="Gastrula zinc finger protein XlCGF7.1" protein_id=Seg6935.1/GoldUCD/D3Y31